MIILNEVKNLRQILITGATGFIGTAVTNLLLEKDIKIVALIHNSKSKNHFPKNELLKCYEVDMSDYDKVDAIIEERGFDALYHFAWQGVSGEGLSNVDIQLANIKSTTDLMKQCKVLGVKKFIGAGSLHELEYNFENRLNQYSDLQLNNLGNIYKISKITAHGYCKLIAKQQDISFSWPIITNTYGIGEKSKRLITSLMDSILENKDFPLTSGEQNYDFIYVSDVAKAFYLIGEKGNSFTNYVIGSGTPQSLRNYLIQLKNIVNPSYNLNFGLKPLKGVNLPKEIYDITTLQKDTGFKPEVTFEEGIQLTLQDKEKRL